MSVRTLYDAELGQFGQTEGVFDPTRGGSSRFRDALSAGTREESDDLHRAMLEHQFSVYYQPVIEVASGRLVGAEALLRWHRNGEILPAERFLRLAERSGLVLRLGARVFRDVAAFHARAGLPAHGGLRISVNLSLTELLHPHFRETILEALRRSGRTPGMIEVEVSEKDLARDPVAVSTAVERLWDAGIGCTLDDLGASVLGDSHLLALPLVATKVDVPSALRTEESLSAHARMIQRAHALDIPVVAKRVSTYDHLELLTWLEISRAQGEALGAPAPASVLRGLLQDAGLLSEPQPRPLPQRGESLVPASHRNGGAAASVPQLRSSATS